MIFPRLYGSTPCLTLAFIRTHFRWVLKSYLPIAVVIKPFCHNYQEYSIKSDSCLSSNFCDLIFLVSLMWTAGYVSKRLSGVNLQEFCPKWRIYRGSHKRWARCGTAVSDWNEAFEVGGLGSCVRYGCWLQDYFLYHDQIFREIWTQVALQIYQPTFGSLHNQKPSRQQYDSAVVAAAFSSSRVLPSSLSTDAEWVYQNLCKLIYSLKSMPHNSETIINKPSWGSPWTWESCP